MGHTLAAPAIPPPNPPAPPPPRFRRAAWVAGAHAALQRTLGDERAAAMGLLAMGASAHAGLLSSEEEAALEAGMREHGRAFHAIQKEFVPRVRVPDLQNYYFNVWKLRATPRSRAW